MQLRLARSLERTEKPEWLEGEIETRDKCMTEEAKKEHKAQNRKKAGAEKAGEPDGDTDDEIAKAKPKKKAAKDKPWDPNRTAGWAKTPRGVMSTRMGRTSAAARPRTARWAWSRAS